MSDFSILCGVCNCKCILQYANETKLAKNLFIQQQRESFYACDECCPLVDELEQKEIPLVFFTLHVNASIVQESNYPEVFPINPYLSNIKYRDLQLNFDNISNAKSIISKAKAILIVAGAGMSSDSGLNVFRSINDNEKLLGSGHVHRNEDIDYQNKPEIAWFYDSSIRRDALNHEPHQGYFQLLNFLIAHCPNYFVLTSNIDNYFIRSGYDYNKIYETHGNIEHIQCGKLTKDNRCNGVFPWTTLPTIDDKFLLCNDASTFPTCPSCGGPARANISHLPDLQEDIDQTYKGRQQFLFMEWLHEQRINNRKNHNDSLVIVEIGSGSSIHGLRSESEILLTSHPYSGIKNSYLIRIDPLLSSVPNSTTNVIGIKDSALSAIQQLFT